MKFPLNDILTDIDFQDIPSYKFVVYDYIEGYREGDGVLLAFDGEQWYHYNLGHCSCFGPLEHGPILTYSISELSDMIYNDNVLEHRGIPDSILDFLRYNMSGILEHCSGV